MADNTPSGSGSSSPEPTPAPVSQPAPAVEQAPPSGPSLEKAPASGSGVEQGQKSVHQIAHEATQQAIKDLNRVDSQGRTPAEAAEAAQVRAEARIDTIAANLVKGANEYAARVAAQATGNDYADAAVSTWSEYQMGLSSSDFVGSGTGVEQAPSTSATEARAVRSSASPGLGAPKHSGTAKSTLSSPKARAVRAEQKAAYQTSVEIPTAPGHTGAAKNTVSAPRGRAERAGQQMFRGLRRLLGKGH